MVYYSSREDKRNEMTHKTKLQFNDSKRLDMVLAGMSREAADTAQVIEDIAQIATYKYNLNDTWKRISAERKNNWKVETTIVESVNTMPYWIAREDDGYIAYLAELPRKAQELEWERMNAYRY